MGVAGLPMFYSGEALGELQYPPVTEQVWGGQGRAIGGVCRCYWLAWGLAWG